MFFQTGNHVYYFCLEDSDVGPCCNQMCWQKIKIHNNIKKKKMKCFSQYNKEYKTILKMTIKKEYIKQFLSAFNT